MNAAQVHLLLNHVPVLGSPFCLLLLLFGLLRGSREVVRAGLLGLVLVALLTVPAYLSGEGAEDLVRPQAGVSTLLMAEHEAAALPALLTVVGVGALALAGLLIGRGERGMPRWLLVAVMAGSVAATALLARAAHLGGQVHHPELRAVLTVGPGGRTV